MQPAEGNECTTRLTDNDDDCSTAERKRWMSTNWKEALFVLSWFRRFRFLRVPVSLSCSQLASYRDQLHSSLFTCFLRAQFIIKDISGWLISEQLESRILNCGRDSTGSGAHKHLHCDINQAACRIEEGERWRHDWKGTWEIIARSSTFARLLDLLTLSRDDGVWKDEKLKWQKQSFLIFQKKELGVSFEGWLDRISFY